MFSQSNLKKMVVLFLAICAVTLLSVTYLSAKGGGRGGNGEGNNLGLGQSAQKGKGGVGGAGGNGGAGGDHGGAGGNGGNGGSGKGGTGSGGNGGSGKGGDGAGGNDGGERGLGLPKNITGPGPTASELANIVKDKNAAIALGKAFFWEMQFGSDGQTACASCHFNAGADSRTNNQTDPGLRRVDGNGNPAAHSTAFPSGFGPNHALSLSDFPLHTSTRDNNNIVGSQGVLSFKFNDVILGQGAENETSVADPVWSVSDGNGGMVNVRRSTPRNAPPVINAVFNYRNFWDGRAQNTFNGVNPFGAGDPNAALLQTDASSIHIVNEVKLRLSNSALASQAVGPPSSDVEMSATGRPFVKMGKKMLAVTPLVLQQV